MPKISALTIDHATGLSIYAGEGVPNFIATVGSRYTDTTVGAVEEYVYIGPLADSWQRLARADEISGGGASVPTWISTDYRSTAPGDPIDGAISGTFPIVVGSPAPSLDYAQSKLFMYASAIATASLRARMKTVNIVSDITYYTTPLVSYLTVGTIEAGFCLDIANIADPAVNPAGNGATGPAAGNRCGIVIGCSTSGRYITLGLNTQQALLEMWGSTTSANTTNPTLAGSTYTGFTPSDILHARISQEAGTSIIRFEVSMNGYRWVAMRRINLSDLIGSSMLNGLIDRIGMFVDSRNGVGGACGQFEYIYVNGWS